MERLSSKAIAGQLFDDCVTYRNKHLFENEDAKLINVLRLLFLEKGYDCLDFVRDTILQVKKSLEHYPYVIVCYRKHEPTYTCSMSNWQSALDQVCSEHHFCKDFKYCMIYDAKENKQYDWELLKSIIKEYYVVTHKCEENDANTPPAVTTTVPDTAILTVNYHMNLDGVGFRLTREELDRGNGDFHYTHVVRNESGRLKERHFTYNVKKVCLG